VTRVGGWIENLRDRKGSVPVDFNQELTELADRGQVVSHIDDQEQAQIRYEVLEAQRRRFRRSVKVVVLLMLLAAGVLVLITRIIPYS
jgi:hypothetical protein